MKGLIILAVAVVVIAAIVIMPIAWIWAVNLLFGLAIPVTPQTWFAALILGGGLFVNNTSSK